MSLSAKAAGIGFILGLIVGPVWAVAAGEVSPAGGSDALRLKTGLVRTSELTVSAEPTRSAPQTPGRYVVQLDRPMNRVLAARLATRGVSLGQYLPTHAYIIQADAAALEELANLEFVHWVGPFQTEWKLDPQLQQRVEIIRSARAALAAGQPDAAEEIDALYAGDARRTLARQGKVQVAVTLFEGEAVADRADKFRAIPGAEVLNWSTDGLNPVVDLIVPVDQVAEVAGRDWVQCVEDAPEGTLRNDKTRWVVQSNVTGQTPLWDHGLHGENQIAGLIDAAVAESHCFFDDTVPPGPLHRKLIAYRGPSGAHIHGTHVAGTLAGDWGTYGAYDTRDGLAYAARISYSDYFAVYSNPSSFISRLTDANNDGAHVHSNSWGDDTTTAYTVWSRQADEFSWLNETDVVVFAITNTSTLRSPENAKNVLAVGASQQTPAQENHCYGGAGPTTDGRRKPEVYAPGCSIQSAYASTPCSTTTLSGTSMAAPAVSAMTVLARQYYTEGFYPTGAARPSDAFVPSGALLRATVLNSAVDMTGVSYGGKNYPNDLEGWGRILMDNALYFPGDSARLRVADVFNADGLSTGESEVYHVHVLSDAEPLRITLTWTDYPAAQNASFTPINDLNLLVTTPGTADNASELYFGNAFDTSVGESIPGGARDSLNNVERVILLAPDAGAYTIEIEGFAVNQSTQGYGLVVNGDISLLPLAPARIYACWPESLRQDADEDADVDLADYASFQQCFGQGIGSFISNACRPHDADCDNDVDLDDFAEFNAKLIGPS